ncbi:conserved protein of unknown function [Ralstonia solanacearum CMR15]|nr:conserved protein of unknown function [Ralstonia solanacearum CMR15]
MRKSFTAERAGTGQANHTIGTWVAGEVLLVRLDMTVGMQSRMAGQCRSVAMAAGDVFFAVIGRGHAACPRRGEARILGIGAANGAQ